MLSTIQGDVVRLSDQIIANGPMQGKLMVSEATAADMNELREELIDLRALRARIEGVAIEYSRESRLIASAAIGKMMEDWLNELTP